MSWSDIGLAVSFVLLVVANIALLMSNHKMMKANESLLTSLGEYETLHQNLMHSRDEWRTKARVLQGKYEPIGDPKVERWWQDT
jgi:hypothetical protein